MTLLRAFDRFWFSPAPAERLAALRILIGGFAVVYLIWRFGALTNVTRFHAAEFHPVGVVRALSSPLPKVLVFGQVVVALAVGLAFVAGRLYRITGPLFALLLLWVTSYRNSWGMVFHVENLMVLHVLLLGLSPAADALSQDARNVPRPRPHGRYGWALRAMCLVTVTTYVLAGIAKLKLAGTEWLTGDFLRAQIAHDNLRKIELGSIYSPLGVALVRYAAPFGVLSILTLVVELGAPIGLLGGRLARLWVLAAWSFHLGVAGLMAIIFPYQLALVAFGSFFEIERWSGWRSLQRVVLRFGSASRASGGVSEPSLEVGGGGGSVPK